MFFKSSFVAFFIKSSCHFGKRTQLKHYFCLQRANVNSLFVFIFMRLIAHVNLSPYDIIDQLDDATTEAEADGCNLPLCEQAEQREEPLGSVNGKPESDDKENTEGPSIDEVQAER